MVVRLGDERLRGGRPDPPEGGYLVGLAEACIDWPPGPGGHRSSSGRRAAIDALVAHRGVGRWTADIYLLMGLGRPDVWPSADLALIVAARELRGARCRARPRLASRRSRTAWRPWRSVAARMLWQAYLLERGRPLDE